MKIYNKRIKELEEVTYFSDTDEITHFFKKTLELLKETGEHDSQRFVLYEIHLFSLSISTPFIFDDYKSRFGPKAFLQDGSPWPSQNFVDDQIKYYDTRLDVTQNLFLKNRYADFLFEYGNKNISKNKFQLSKILVPLLIDTAKLNLQKGDLNCFFTNIARAVEVTLKIKKIDLLKNIIPTLFNALRTFKECNAFQCFLEISKIVRIIVKSPLSSEINKEKQDFCIECLQNAKQFYRDENNYDIHRVFCGELVEWMKLSKDNVGVNKYQCEIGLSFEEEAVYQQGREKSALGKAHILESALKYYSDIGKTKKIDELKVKILNAYNEVKENGEIKARKYKFSMPIDEVQKILAIFLQGDLDVNLSVLKCSLDFIPKVSVINQVTKEQESTIMAFVGQGILHDGKKVLQASDESEVFNVNFNRNYIIYLQLILTSMLVPLFEKLISKGLTADILYEKIKAWPLLQEDNSELIDTGLKRFFEGDYISSLHVLVPQYESVLRRMFSQWGFATTSIKKGVAQHEETFNAFLERKDVQEELGEDLHKFIEMVMVQQTGFNLRNKIAHGLITVDECNKDIGILVIYMYLLLTNFTLNRQ